MSEENKLLTKDEEKELHDWYMSPITAVNVCLTQIKENRGQLVETLNQIRTEGGISKLKGLRKMTLDVLSAFGQGTFDVSIRPIASGVFSLTKVDLAVIDEMLESMRNLADVLNVIIKVDQYDDISTVMYNLQTGRSKFVVDSLNENGLTPDDDLDNDNNDTITLSDLLKAERSRKETNK